MDFQLGFGKGKKDGAAAAPKKPKNDAVLKVVEFFDKNPIMKIVVPAVLFIIVVAVVIFVIFGDGVLSGTDKDVGTEPNEITISQDTQTEIKQDKEIVALIESDPLSEDILANAKYTGYLVGNTGLKIATIEVGSGGDVLVMAPGEKIDDTEWVLKECNKNYVIFEAGDVSKKITRE